MKDRDREIISHLMDGEWGGLDLSRCLGDVCESEEKKQVWARYHLVRDGMRSESVDETFSIADRVSAAIADEPSYSNVTSIGSSDSSQGQEQVGAHHDNTVAVQPQAEWAGTGTQRQSSQPARSRWGLGATGFGIAASAALATVVGLDYWETRQLTSTPSALVAQSAPAQQEPKASPATVSMVASNTQSPVMQNVANRGVFAGW